MCSVRQASRGAFEHGIPVRAVIRRDLGFDGRHGCHLDARTPQTGRRTPSNGRKSLRRSLGLTVHACPITEYATRNASTDRKIVDSRPRREHKGPLRERLREFTGSPCTDLGG